MIYYISDQIPLLCFPFYNKINILIITKLYNNKQIIIHTQVRIYTYTHTYIPQATPLTHIYTHTHTHIHAHIHIHIHIHMHKYIHI